MDEPLASGPTACLGDCSPRPVEPSGGFVAARRGAWGGTRLAESELGGDFDIVYDNGCFNGLPGGRRLPYAQGVSHDCRPVASYLLFALQPARLRRCLGPAGGVASSQVEELFRPWFEILRVEPPRKGLFQPTCYEMRRT